MSAGTGSSKKRQLLQLVNYATASPSRMLKTEVRLLRTGLAQEGNGSIPTYLES
jgi:hypothetical protein